MKARVFLSHSKLDREIIEHIANDLRLARIDVWYDEWEIPPGESFRVKIFENGMPNCDLFFVYLTSNSADSYWVRRELDAAFIHDAQNHGGFLSLFVDSDETRQTLPLDLRSLHSPILNQSEYHRPLYQLISRIWEAKLRKLSVEIQQGAKIELLQLQKEVAQLETKIVKLESNSLVDVTQAIDILKNTKFSLNNTELTLENVFINLSSLLASGTNDGNFGYRASQLFGISEKELSFDRLKPYYAYDFIGPLIVNGLVKVVQGHGDYEDSYCLTDYGIAVLKKIC